VSKSTRRIKAVARQPVPAISGIEPRNLTVPILTINPLKKRNKLIKKNKRKKDQSHHETETNIMAY
jgi:hypothetical protein